MDFASTIPMLCAELNAAGTADLVFWSEDELVRYADLEFSKLSGALMLLVDEQDLAGIANQSGYDLAHTTDDTPLDTRFVSLIHAVWNITGVATSAALSPMNMREIEARDANWATSTAFSPLSWIGDWVGTGIVMTYPQPTLAGTLSVFCQRAAPSLATGSTSIPSPAVLADLLHLRVLADARSKRSDAWMPEAAALADQLADLLEHAFESYYGSAK